MRIHSDKLGRHDIFVATGACRGADVYADVSEHGSRSRARAFQVRLYVYDGGPGTSNTMRPNFYHRIQDGSYALTYDQWGDFLAHLYLIDPEMKCEYYDGAEDFHAQTDGKYQEVSA